MPRPIPSSRTLLAAALAALPLSAAAEDPGARAPVAALELLPGWRTESGTRMTALRVLLAPGWKTYWRAPGDSGIPPRFGWDGSHNIAAVAFHWPRPEVYEINGMQSIGYYDELILPIELTPSRAGEPMRVEAAIEFGVCREVCVPMEGRVSAELGGAGAADARISAALAAQPVAAASAGLRAVSCAVEPIDDGLRLTARIDMPAIGADEVAVFELADQSVWISAAEGGRDGDRFTATADFVPPSGAPFLLDRSEVRITLLGDGRAVELTGCPAG